MNKTFSFYEASTGIFHTGHVSLPADRDGLCLDLIANTPPGHVAFEGRVDHLSQRYDVGTGSVVDYQPPAPPADDESTWSWDADVKRWQSSPTLGRIKRQRVAEARAAISMLELDQARPLREITVAANVSPGQPVPPATVQRLATLDAQIKVHRTRLQLIVAAADVDALDAAVALPVP